MRKIIYILALGLILSIVSAFIVSYKNTINYKHDIDSKINNLFNSKLKISDGQFLATYLEYKFLDSIEDKSIIEKTKKFPKELLPVDILKKKIKIPSFIAYPFMSSGFTYVKLRRMLDENIEPVEEPKFYLDSIVSYDIVFYGKSNDLKNLSKTSINNKLEKITLKCYNGYEEENTDSYHKGKYNDIVNFGNIKNRYFYLEYKGVDISRKNVKNYDAWCDVGNYRIYSRKELSIYRLKKNSNLINKDRFTYFSYSLIVYLLIFIVIFLVIKIFNRK